MDSGWLGGVGVQRLSYKHLIAVLGWGGHRHPHFTGEKAGFGLLYQRSEGHKPPPHLIAGRDNRFSVPTELRGRLGSFTHRGSEGRPAEVRLPGTAGFCSNWSLDPQQAGPSRLHGRWAGSGDAQGPPR